MMGVRMSLLPALGLSVGGLLLVLFFAERLVDSTVAVARRLGLSAFLISVLFIGFDPENLAVGAVASYEGTAGIALGTIVGSAMVALTLAFGITAVIVPLDVAQAPRRILALVGRGLSAAGLRGLRGGAVSRRVKCSYGEGERTAVR